MIQDPGEARASMEMYSPILKVDSQACDLQMMAPPPPRQRQVGQTVLYLLLVLTLCGIIVEACFIYKLYNTMATADTPTTQKHQQAEGDAPGRIYRTEVKPPKPSAHLTASTHLPRQDGLMMWTSVGGDAFTHDMDYTEGKLFVKTEGFYFIYSKVFFSEPSRAAFTHTVMKSSPHSPSKELELMRTFRFLDRGDRRGGMLNSYLGGVYLLHEGDAIFVTVHNHTGLLRQVSADNFFAEGDAPGRIYRTEDKPQRPSAHLTASTHLPRQDGLMMWTSVGGDAFTHDMDYTEGKLFVKTEGFYFIYSKVLFSEPSRAAFTHTVMKSSPDIHDSHLELMRTFQFQDSSDRKGGLPRGGVPSAQG